MRKSRFAAPGLMTLAFILLMSMASLPAAAYQAGTPVATPAAPVATQPPAQPTAVPVAAATPVPAAQAAPTTNVVTLVFWYANSANADIIELYPLVTDAGFVASPAPGASPVGTVDFPDEGAPSVVVGATTFNTYPRADGVVERWAWFDDFEGARPATLVMQLAGSGGTYQDYYGTGTFMSRDEGGAGGVLILALRPPDPEAQAAQAAAEAAAATEAAAAEAPVEPIVEEVAPEGVTVTEGETVTQEAPIEEAPVEEAPAA